MGACAAKEEPYLPGRDFWTPNNTNDNIAPPKDHNVFCQKATAGTIILVGDTDLWRYAAAVVPFRFTEAGDKKRWVNGHDWGVVYTKGKRVCIQSIGDFIREVFQDHRAVVYERHLMIPTKMSQEQLAHLADCAVDVVREEPEALIQEFEDLSVSGDAEEFNAYVVSKVLRGLPGLSFEFAQVMGGAVCGAVAVHQHPMVPEGLCETYLSTSDEYEYTCPARVVWHDGVDVPEESFTEEAKPLATAKVALPELLQHVAERADAGPVEGGIANQYPEGFFSDEGALAKSGAAIGEPAAGTVGHPELGRSKTLPHKLSLTRLKPIEIEPATLIASRPSVTPQLQTTKSM